MNVLILPSWYPTPENPTSGIFFKEQDQALFKNGINIYILVQHVYNIRNIFNFFKIKNKIQIYNDNGIKTHIVHYLNIFPRMKILFYYYSSILLKRNIDFIKNKYKIEFDLVHIHSAFFAGIFYYLSKYPIKYILTEHASFYSRNLLSHLDKHYVPKVLSSSSALIAVSDGLKSNLQIFTKKEINVIFNLISFKNTNCQTDLNKNKFRFFSLGSNLLTKGFDILISSYSNSNKTILENSELYIAGLSQKELVILQKMIDKLSFKCIRLFGHMSRDEVAYNMFNCDCFILPSRFETFGVVFAEAMYFGKPVIASKTGGPDSFVTPKTGLLVPVEDIEETTKAIEQIYQQHSDYDADYIKQYAIDNFSPEIITQKIINLYKDVISS